MGDSEWLAPTSLWPLRRPQLLSPLPLWPQLLPPWWPLLPLRRPLKLLLLELNTLLLMLRPLLLLPVWRREKLNPLKEIMRFLQLLSFVFQFPLSTMSLPPSSTMLFTPSLPPSPQLLWLLLLPLPFT